MIYILYLVVAAIVVGLSVKASNYVDLLDKNTNLSGAFLGGIMLSAVTSLPELFTSISATIMIKKPGLCLGNILGSDLFNLMALSVIILFFFKGFSKGKIARSYRYVALSVIGIYLVILANFVNILSFEVFTVSITSIIILFLYGFGARHLAGSHDSDDSIEEFDETLSTNLTVKQIGFRFFITSILIIVFSIIITYITDEISVRLNLGQGLAGALFLGIATSLPEVTSTITLFKIRNYDIAVGNIIGSNLFNFIILAIADVISLGLSGVYSSPDGQTVNLLIFGLVATPLFWIMLKFRNKGTQAVCCLGIIASYLGFLLI